MRILVTGKQGQVVQALVKRGLETGFEIITIGRPELDMADPAQTHASLRAAIKETQPTLIVNAAAYTAVDQAEDEPELAHSVNALSAGAIAQAAAEAGLPIVQISTDYVFDGTKDGAYVETDIPNPQGTYGASKLAGEESVRTANLQHLILRTAWVYSPFGKNFVKTMLRLAETRDEVGVVADQFGNPTSAFDIADGILATAQRIEADATSVPWGTYHLAGTGSTNWAGFAEEIFAQSAARGGPTSAVKHITTADYLTKAKRPANSQLDCAAFEAAFGWRAQDWQTGLRQTIEALQNEQPATAFPNPLIVDEVPLKRTCILVLGMHRSGTSALTRLINMLGAHLPKRLMGPYDGNEIGHFEPLEIVRFNDGLLLEGKSSWDDWSKFDLSQFHPDRMAQIKNEILAHYDEDFGQSNIAVLKDPRISRISELYINTLESHGIGTFSVISFRHPLDVAWSLADRKVLWDPRFITADGLLLWLRHCLDAERATRGKPRVVLSYDTMMREPLTALKSISDACPIKFPVSAEEANSEATEFIQPQLRHHHNTEEAFHENPLLSGWVEDTYRAFCNLEAESFEEEAYQKLDAVSLAVDSAEPLLRSISAELKQEKSENSAAKTQNNEIALSLQSSVLELDELKKQATELESKLQLSQSNHESSIQQYQSSSLEIEALRAEKEVVSSLYSETALALQTRILELDTVRTLTEELQNQVLVSQSKQKALTQQYDTSLLIIDAARFGNEEINARYNEISLKLQTATQKYESAYHELEAARKDNEAIAKRYDETKQTLQSSKQELAALKAQEIELKQQLQLSQSNHETSIQQYENSLLTIQTVEAAYDVLKNNFEDVSSALHISAQDLSEAKFQIGLIQERLNISREAERKSKQRSHDLNKDLEDNSIVIADLQKRLVEIEQSSSWRLTYPLREAKRLWKGWPRNDTSLATLPYIQKMNEPQSMIFFTIASRNFTAFALTLFESIKKHYPNATFYLALADSYEAYGRFDPLKLPFPVLSLDEIGLVDWQEMASRYNITEFNTAIKPTVISHLMSVHSGVPIVYLDPDIIVTSRMIEIEDAFTNGASVILTPHVLGPAENVEVHDQKMLQFGIYNLGFLGIANSHETLKLMEWWARRLRNECVIRLEDGIFVDQKWADLFPAYVNNAHILRHPGYNVAYWNVSQRKIEMRGNVFYANNEPLRFAHFSGSKLDDPSVYSRHTGQFHAGNIGDLRILLDQYRDYIMEAGHAEYSSIPYAYNWNGQNGVNLHTPEPEANRQYTAVNQLEIKQAIPTVGEERLNTSNVLGYNEDPMTRDLTFTEIARAAAGVAGGWQNIPGKALRAYRDGGLAAIKHRWRFATMRARTAPINANLRSTIVDLTPSANSFVANPLPTPSIEPLRPHASVSASRLLFIDWSTPRPDRDAGSLTAYHMMQIFINLGYDVTFVPSDLENFGDYTTSLESIGVRCISKLHYVSVRAFLEKEGDGYGFAVICRAPIAELYVDDIRKLAPQAKIVLNTSDLHYLRDVREAELVGTPEQMAWALTNKKHELETISKCDVTIVMSSVEQGILARELPHSVIKLIPLMFVDVDPAPSTYSERKDILFIGGFPHIPNVDAALYFAREIFPLIRQELPDVTWHIVGNAPPAEVMALANTPGITVHGFVQNIEPLFRSVRLSVAPLRYGAGIKGKLGTSLAYGVPAIATSIAAEGMKLKDGKHVKIADEPAKFARELIDLYRSPERWKKMSRSGRDLMLSTYSVAAGEARLANLMSEIDCEFRHLEAYELRSKASYDLLVEYLGPRITERAAQEEMLIRRDTPNFFTPGHCAFCGKDSEFNCSMMYSYEETADGLPIPNWREHLDCKVCGLQNRLRAAMHIFGLQLRPQTDASIYITEQATSLYQMLKLKYPNLVGSEYLGDSAPLGQFSKGFRNEDLTRLTFADESFDFILSFDVMEHVGDDIAAFQSMYRCLKPGGKLLFAAPFDKSREKKLIRAILHDNGTIEHLLPPEYHGNPVDHENGALCFRYFAWDVVDDLKAAGFTEARVLHYWSRDYLYLGREQFMFIAEKPCN